ncbi:Copper-containing nitrite reductase [Mycobacteroides abscessus subsp. abscessus]|nr:Copper-containing nitrite reductase [Mycobacteroides abscessus subsp. abscessus]
MFDADAPAWLAEARDRLTVAHALAGVAGWVGLTMGGTLVTLGPTAMRTRMDPRAVSFATSALPMWVAALLVAGTGAVAGSMRVASVGLLVVVGAAALGVGVPLVRVALKKGPAEYGAWSLMLGAAWILIAGAGASLRAFEAADATGLRSAFLAWMPILGAAGLGQLFVGALTYLMPVVIGGGPSAVRVGVGVLEAGAPIREAARNVAALLALAVASLGGTSAERLTIAAWVVLLATYLVDIVLMARCGVAQARAKRAAASSPTTTQGGRRG